MPMSEEGHKAMRGFMKQYGKKKGKKVAFAKANKEGKGSKLFSLLHGK